MRVTAAASAALLSLVLVLGGCSDDPDVSVRADGGDGDAEVDVRTDGSTTTIDRPSAGVSEATGASQPEPPAVSDDALTGPASVDPEGSSTIGPIEPVDPGAPLGTALLANGPTGWERAPDDAPDLGALTVIEAAQALGDPEAELALLTTRRLRAAHARRWVGADGATATLVAYQFADAEGALSYEVDSMISLIGEGAVESTGAAMSRAFRWQGGGTTIDGRSLRRGDRIYLVIVRQGTPALADALVSAQATQLAG